MRTLEELSREQVDEWLDDLREDYDRFERVEKTWDVDAESYEAHRTWIERGTNGGAGVWLARENGAVLLVRDEGDDGWADPGGKREDGETFEEAARREVREEANVECRRTDVLEAHVLEVIHGEDPDAPSLWSLIVIFAGEYISGHPRPRDGEIAEVEWFDVTPDVVQYSEVADWPIPFDP